MAVRPQFITEDHWPTAAGLVPLATATVITLEVVLLAEASLALADRVCVPLASAGVSHEKEYGPLVCSGPRFTLPSRINWRPTTPTLSEAVALSVTVPETVAPFAGAVSDTVGGVVSGAWTVKLIGAASDPVTLLRLLPTRMPVRTCGPGATLVRFNVPLKVRSGMVWELLSRVNSGWLIPRRFPEVV